MTSKSTDGHSSFEAVSSPDSLFGNVAAGSSGSRSSGSLFDNLAPGSSSFGAALSSGSLFGNMAPEGSGFGAGASSGYLFSNVAPGSSSFGAGVSTGSLFGNVPLGSSSFGAAPSSSSLFGNSAEGSSSWGAAASSGPLFGNAAPGSSSLGAGLSSGSLFGNVAPRSFSFEAAPSSGSLFGLVAPSAFSFSVAPSSGALFGSAAATELELSVILGSNKTEVKVMAQSSWTSKEVVNALKPNLEEDEDIEKITFGVFHVPLMDGVSLTACGIRDKDTVVAVMSTLNLSVRLLPEAITVEVVAKRSWRKADLIDTLQPQIDVCRAIGLIHYGPFKKPLSDCCTLAEAGLQDGAELEASTAGGIEISCVSAAGDILAQLSGLDSWTLQDVISALNPRLQAGVVCKGLLWEDCIVDVLRPLADMGPGPLQLNAVLGSPSKLCLVEACSAKRLAKKHSGRWYKDIRTDREHPSLESASPLAQEIANGLNLQFGISFTMMTKGGRNLFAKDVVVISSPSCDTKEACVDALRIGDTGGCKVCFKQYHEAEFEDQLNAHLLHGQYRCMFVAGGSEDLPFIKTETDKGITRGIRYLTEKLEKLFELEFGWGDEGSTLLLAGYTKDRDIVGLLLSLQTAARIQR